jgi:hypothetical protein
MEGPGLCHRGFCSAVLIEGTWCTERAGCCNWKGCTAKHRGRSEPPSCEFAVSKAEGGVARYSQSKQFKAVQSKPLLHNHDATRALDDEA